MSRPVHARTVLLGGNSGGSEGSMSLAISVQESENAVAAVLRAKQAGISDATGKGAATEAIIEELIAPFLPPPFKARKGAVVEASAPDKQSGAIDRVIYDPTAAPALVDDDGHTVFPIEAVAGMLQITMHLDATKLRSDLALMQPVKAMRTRRYLAPVANRSTMVVPFSKDDCLSPRCFVVGMAADPKWRPETIASALRQIQLELGPPAHVHGLYVIGIGYFETEPSERGNPTYRIQCWPAADRLFRFTSGFRQAFDRWPKLLDGWTTDLARYIPQSGPTFVSE